MCEQQCLHNVYMGQGDSHCDKVIVTSTGATLVDE